MFLVVVDAYSKWLDVHMTISTTTLATLDLLRRSFATLGLPEVVVSDNAANFTSEEFRSFMKRNGIKHVRTPPYHPASNGIAERAVQTLKDSIKKLKKGSLETRLSRFLFKYRVTPHSVTGFAPADIMFGRRLRTHLDVLKPDLSRKVICNKEHQKNWYNIRVNQGNFKVGDLVYARNYATGPKWLPGKIVESSGNVLFTVALIDGRQVRKHTDQLIKRYADSNDQADEEQLDHDDIPVSSNNEDFTNTAPTVNNHLILQSFLLIQLLLPILLLIHCLVRLLLIVRQNLLFKTRNRAENLLRLPLLLVVRLKHGILQTGMAILMLINII
uniref:Integrase catalytic domain-containing protein n=1 Tax=Amphimedon queenslandica TaxID=400682 RepID=A0A1X7TCL9_AMPQE